MHKQCIHPDGCSKKAVKRNMCDLHYRRFMKTGDMGPLDVTREYTDTKICKIEGCSLPKWAKGYCNMHYKRNFYNDDPGDAKRKRNDIKIDCPEGYKICRACNEIKKLDAFTKDMKIKNKVKTYCKECSMLKHIFRKFNLTKEEYFNMMKKQCAICGNVKTLGIDHCHISGKVRDVLCRNCNSALGLLQENKKIVLNSIEYCENPSYYVVDTVNVAQLPRLKFQYWIYQENEKLFEHGLKMCSVCEEIKITTEFAHAKYGHKGFVQHCKKCSKLKNIYNTYGLTEREYIKLIDDKTCNICNKNCDPVIDHCHKTNKIRGVLCDACNCAIGLFREDITIFKNAIAYIEKHDPLKELTKVNISYEEEKQS